MADGLTEMGSFFNARAAGYDAHMRAVLGRWRGFDEFYRRVALPIPKTKLGIRLLDLGCGTGLELKEVFKRAPAVMITGIDLSGNMLTILRRHYSKRMGQIDLLQGSYEEIPLGERRYDYALSVMTMHHFTEERKKRVYRSILEALKPGGMYIEGDYTVAPAAEREHRAAYESTSILPGFERESFYHLDIPFTVYHQLKLLDEAGFSDLEICHLGKNKAIYTAIRPPLQE